MMIKKVITKIFLKKKFKRLLSHPVKLCLLQSPSKSDHRNIGCWKPTFHGQLFLKLTGSAHVGNT